MDFDLGDQSLLLGYNWCVPGGVSIVVVYYLLTIAEDSVSKNHKRYLNLAYFIFIQPE